MRVEKALRMLYGRFFYRFPNGESAADVYDRITGSLFISTNIVPRIMTKGFATYVMCASLQQVSEKH